MAVSLGVAECLREHGADARTKWPNDVLAGGRKIAGVLPEVAPPAAAGAPTALVVGIGANVMMSAEEAAAIDQPATSLLVETGRGLTPEQVLTRLLAVLPGWLERWEEGGFEALRPEWESRCVGLGEWVTAVDGDSRRSGVLAGFGASGQLLLKVRDQPVEVWSGHLLLADRS
jgi:BirA family biotin operon repressor/biotin-[acetyl-CoA-carboxylase] ligase